MSRLSLPCVKCDKPLTNCDEGVDNQPSGGTEFVAVGHYGSTIHDPLPVDGEPMLELVANLCDTCIMRAIDAGTIQSRGELAGESIVLSRHPIADQSRAWILAQNEKHYGSAWGDDEHVDYEALMRLAGWEGDIT